MSWFTRRPNPSPPVRLPHAHPPPDDQAVPTFVCTKWGRTDLPEAGDWDPPICLECDAAINEDALTDETARDDDSDRG